WHAGLAGLLPGGWRCGRPWKARAAIRSHGAAATIRPVPRAIGRPRRTARGRPGRRATALRTPFHVEPPRIARAALRSGRKTRRGRRARLTWLKVVRRRAPIRNFRVPERRRAPPGRWPALAATPVPRPAPVPAEPAPPGRRPGASRLTLRSPAPPGLH